MNKHSLTLLEVVISALILSITTASILYLFSTGKIVVSHTGRRIQAMDFARQTLEELRNAVSADTWPNTGDLAGGGPTSQPLSPSKLRDNFSGTREYTVTDIDADGDTVYEDGEYKRVTVTVDWSEPSE